MAPRATGYKSEYPVTLSDGVHTVGIMTQSKTGIRRLPRGAGVERKAIRQNNWTGGRGNERFSTDTTRFYESTNLWSTVEGQICNGPLRCIASVKAFNASATYFPNSRLPATSFVPGTDGLLRKITIPTGGGFTAATLSFIARKQGTPTNSLTITLYTDVDGAPGAIVKTATLSPADVTDNETTYRTITFSQALTAATVYWVKFTAPLESTGAWYILCERVSGQFLYEVYVRLAATTTDRKKVKFFEYKRGLYALCIYRNGTTAAKLLRNGDRGVANGTQNVTTLLDDTRTAGTAWTVGEWAGCVVLITAGINKGEYRTILSNTANTLTISGDPWPKPCADNGSEYVILGSDKWTEVTLTAGGAAGLNASATDVAVFNSAIYFAQGSDGNGTAMYRLREWNNGGVWTIEGATDGTNKADYLVASPHWSTGLPALWIARNVDTMVQVAPAVTWGTNLTFEAGMPCGEPESQINSIIEYNNQIYCGKDDSVWQGREGSFKKVPIGIDKARDERNGVAMIWWNTQIFMSLLGGLERLYGTTLDDMGPDRDQGMISARRGAIVDLVNVANMLYCSYQSRDGNSSILATTDPGGDWHNLVTLGQAVRSSGIFYQTVPGRANRLWVSDRYELWYCIMPDELHNPIRDDNMRYAWESFLTTSWIDADSPELDHYFDELRMSTRNLPTGITAEPTVKIEIEYQTDDLMYEDEWTPFTNTMFDTDSIIVQSPYQRVTVGDGNVTGRRIRFRFRLMCDCQTPVIMNSWELRLNTMNEVLYDYLFDMRIADKMELMDGNDTLDKWSTMMGVLESWKEDATPLTLRTPMPGTSGVIDSIVGHIDPVSIVTQEWNDKETKLSGQIVFKQT